MCLSKPRSSPTPAVSLIHNHTHMSLLSMLSTRRTGSLTFISSVTFIPYTILSTASPRCCCARFSADKGCGRRATAAARVDATAAPGATPLLRSNADVVRVNRACIVLEPSVRSGAAPGTTAGISELFSAEGGGASLGCRGERAPVVSVYLFLAWALAVGTLWTSQGRCVSTKN